MRRYRGASRTAPFVMIHIPHEAPQPLPIRAYPYEQHQALHPHLIAWWQGHDAAIRLAASLLADVFGASIHPYEQEVLVQPDSVRALGIVVEPVATYLARAFADEVIAHLPHDQFELTEVQIREWYDAKQASRA